MCWGGRVLSWWFRSDMFRLPGKMLASCSTGKSVSHKTVAAYSGIIVLPPFRKKKLFPLYST